MFNFINVFCSRRRWLKRIFMPLLDDSAVIKLNDFNLDICFNPKDLTGPSFHLAYDLDKGFKNYEEIDKKEILNNLPSSGVFVDIGANIGLFSLFIAKQRADITSYAFEPEPLNFKNLEKSKILNKLELSLIHI